MMGPPDHATDPIRTGSKVPLSRIRAATGTLQSPLRPLSRIRAPKALLGPPERPLSRIRGPGGSPKGLGSRPYRGSGPPQGRLSHRCHPLGIGQQEGRHSHRRDPRASENLPFPSALPPRIAMCQPTGGPWRQMLLASCGDLGPGQICLLTHFGQIPCPSGHAPTQERHRGPGEASLEASRPRSLGEGSRASLGASRGVGGGGSRGRPVGSRTCISNQIGKVLWLERGPELPQGPRLRPAGPGGPHGGK